MPILVKDTGFKSYMDYRKVTSKRSKQYKLIHSDKIKVCDDGLLRTKQGHIGIAIGQYYGLTGDKLKIHLDNGYSFKAIILDSKAKKDTIKNAASKKKRILEFVVDTKKLDKKVLRAGNISKLSSKFDGKVERIFKL